MNKILLSLFLLLGFGSVQATEVKHFIDIPKGLSIKKAMTTVANAAKSRRWTVLTSDNDNNKLVIQLVHRDYNCKLDFTFTKDKITYEDFTTYYRNPFKDSDDEEETRTPKPVPPSWLANIRRDTNRFFMVYEMNKSIVEKEPSASGESVEKKLEKLKDLHSKGLITEEEYEAKKKDVLSNY